jgi:hypothetical protein
MQSLKLNAPDGAVIVGFLTENGGSCPFECSYGYHNGQATFAYKLPNDTLNTLASKDGERVMVDANGKHWLSSDVEFAATPPRA